MEAKDCGCRVEEIHYGPTFKSYGQKVSHCDRHSEANVAALLATVQSQAETIERNFHQYAEDMKKLSQERDALDVEVRALKAMNFTFAGQDEALQDATGETVMTIKEMEGQILEAIHPWNEARCRRCGWPIKERLEDGCTKQICRFVTNDPAFRRADTPPDISNAGYFWPMFEEWRQRKDHDYINISDTAPVHIDYQCRSLPSGDYTFRIYIGLVDKARFEAQAPTQIDAGLRAWHAALVALGKIKETR